MSPRRKKRSVQKIEDFGFLFWIAGIFVAYFIAELVLSYRPHPLHWLVAAAGGLIAYVAIYAYVRLRKMRP